jgi:hypothetical protein
MYFIAMCGAGVAWNAGRQECPDSWFEYPGDDEAA